MELTIIVLGCQIRAVLNKHASDIYFPHMRAPDVMVSSPHCSGLSDPRLAQ
jgi:hypothetical protein